MDDIMARIALFAGNGVPAVSGFQVKSSLVSLEQAPRIRSEEHTSELQSRP